MQDQIAQELVRSCSEDGGSESWDALLERFGAALAAGVRKGLVIAGRAADGPIVEDLLQDTYCRLLARDARVLRRCRGRREGEIGSYLSHIARTVALDRVRADTAAKRGGRFSAESEGGGTAARRATETAPSPEARAMRRECRRLFFRRCGAILVGPTRRRDLWLLYLSYFEGCTSREIADRLGGALTQSSVDSRIHRLRTRLARGGVRLPPRRGG